MNIKRATQTDEQMLLWVNSSVIIIFMRNDVIIILMVVRAIEQQGESLDGKVIHLRACESGWASLQEGVTGN